MQVLGLACSFMELLNHFHIMSLVIMETDTGTGIHDLNINSWNGEHMTNIYMYNFIFHVKHWSFYCYYYHYAPNMCVCVYFNFLTHYIVYIMSHGNKNTNPIFNFFFKYYYEYKIHHKKLK